MKAPKKNTTGVSQSEFARRNKVSQPAVAKAIKSGRLPVTPDGKLGADAQRAWDVLRSTRAKHGSDVSKLAAVRLEREQTKLENEKLALAERRRKLVDTDKVDVALAVRFQQFRDRTRRISHVLSSRLAMQPVEVIRPILRDELDALLLDLSGIKEFTDEK